MNEFFKNIWHVLCHLKDADSHQRALFAGSFAAYLLLGVVFGYVSSVIFTLVLGFLFEITYCYVPYKEMKVWRWTVELPDYNLFLSQLRMLDIKAYHQIMPKNMYLNVSGILLAIAFRLVLLIF